MTLYIGVDCFQTRPNTHVSLNCRACGTKMNVRREVMVQTGPYHPKSLNDVFTCPHSNNNWHDKVVSIYQEMSRTSSPSMKNLFEKDIQDIMRRL